MAPSPTCSLLPTTPPGYTPLANPNPWIAGKWNWSRCSHGREAAVTVMYQRDLTWWGDRKTMPERMRMQIAHSYYPPYFQQIHQTRYARKGYVICYRQFMRLSVTCACGYILDILSACDRKWLRFSDVTLDCVARCDKTHYVELQLIAYSFSFRYALSFFNWTL